QLLTEEVAQLLPKGILRRGKAEVHHLAPAPRGWAAPIVAARATIGKRPYPLPCVRSASFPSIPRGGRTRREGDEESKVRTRHATHHNHRTSTLLAPLL